MEYPLNKLHSYHKLNKFILSLLGMWPYDSRQTIFLHRFIVHLIFFSGIIAEFLKLSADEFDVDIVLEVIPITIVSTVVILWSFIAYYNTEIFIDLWQQMKDDWASERSKEETKLKDSFARDGNRYILYMAAFSSMAILGIVSVTTFYARILDIILPLNESHPNQLPFSGGYFVDIEKYYYYILLHVHVIFTTGAMMCLAFQSMLCTHIQHIFGMFAVIGYRLQNAIPNVIDEKDYQKPSISKTYRQSIRMCIMRHQKALQFASSLQSYYQPLFGLSVPMVILVIAPTLYRITNKNLVQYKDFFQIFLVLIVPYVLCAIGQKLIDTSMEIADKAYFGQWYACSVQVQKMLLPILKRSEKPCMISAFKLYTLSVDCFRMLVQTGVSYFTVLKQVSH